MKQKQLTAALAFAALIATTAKVNAAETLASWTFQTGYTTTAIDDTHKLYTPDPSAAMEGVTGWFNAETAIILPETSIGDASTYKLSGFSQGRYWSLCDGYGTRVLRIENTVENPSDDYTNPENHLVYYELSFPTKGYKDIEVTFAIAPGNNTQTPFEVVMSTDDGNTWVDLGSKNSSGVWFQYEDVSMAMSASNKDKVIVRLLPTAGTTNWNMRNISISAEESADEPLPSYSFNLTSGMDGAGNISCAPGGNEFEQGTQVTVTATPNFGYTFISWTDSEGNVVSTENPYTFEIENDSELVAQFKKLTLFTLNLELLGGANPNLVQIQPEGDVQDGVRYYEEGTEVVLTTLNNRILTFTKWEDNTNAPTRNIVMDSDKNIKAEFSAEDYIVGWDLYYDDPNRDRPADYKADSDNPGKLSLRNPEGGTSTWLPRGIKNGAENGKWGARVWRLLADKYYFEASFSTKGYCDVKVAAALGTLYNSHSTNYLQYSLNGTDFTTVDTYTLVPGWTTNEFELPADASDAEEVWIRFMPDYDSELVNFPSDYDGLCISDIFVMANKKADDDEIAPKAVSVLPAEGSEDVTVTGSIVINFDETIQLGTGDATLNGEVLSPRVSGMSLVYSYGGLNYATPYSFSLPAGAVTDRSGNPCEALTTTFTTMERPQPETRLFDAIVATDGTGDYATLQEAIDAAPEGRVKPWLIFVKNGNYKEHIDIPENKPMLHIIGQDRDKTVVLDDKLCGGENALHMNDGATVVVHSNDCFFENITLENSYGHEKQTGPQALALNTIGDRTVFNNVAMLSYQDTWYTPSNSNYRVYVNNSLIEGAVDFIYNSGNIYIDNTILYINRNSGGYIVAPSHDADVEWGYVFNNCTITAPGNPSETEIWLGRPWHNYPKTVFLNTKAEVTIPAEGWYETMGGLPAIWADWNTTDGNGNPLDLSQRRDTYYKIVNEEKVYGTAKNHLTDEEAARYTLKNVLSGSDNWHPVLKTTSCDAPAPVHDAGVLSWEEVPYAICYLVTKNDEFIGFTTDTQMNFNVSRSGDETDSDEAPVYAVQAVNEFGGLSPKGLSAQSPSSVINSVATEGEGVVIGIYDLQGRSLPSPTKGINIVKTRMDDGNIKVKKIIVR